VACLDDLLWCNVDEDLSVNIRGWFGSCGGWTLLLRLLVSLILVWFVNMDVTIIDTRANRILSGLVYLVSPLVFLSYSAVCCSTQALPNLLLILLLAGCVVGS
jgi:hypothetical protein